MIISASRRTDIPAFFSEKFYNEIAKGFTYSKNPYNGKEYRVDLSPSAVDAIVFWTKNAKPMLPKLHLLKDYTYYFQYTITPYDAAIEPGLGSVQSRFDTFKELSETIGKDRIIWRYDPIIFDTMHSPAWHVKVFEAMRKAIAPYTEKVVISFVDVYPKLKNYFAKTGQYNLKPEHLTEFAKILAQIAKSENIEIASCAENIELSSVGIKHNACVDKDLIERLSRKPLSLNKDTNQRGACLCAKAVDIETYNTCKHNCAYCYANNH